MSWMDGIGAVVMALAAQAADGSTATPKPDVSAVVARAAAQVSNFEEDAAHKAMTELVARSDLTPAERAQAELWRGVAALSQVQEEEARRAFSVARACQADLTLPNTLSPKIREFFQKTAPGRCGNAQTLAEEDAAAARKAADSRASQRPLTEEPTGRGPNKPLLAGAGLGAGAGVGALLAGMAVLAALLLVSLSFPVVAAAQAQKSAQDVYRVAFVALGMRGGGLGVGLLGALLLSGSVALGAGALALLALGVFR